MSSSYLMIRYCTKNKLKRDNNYGQKTEERKEINEGNKDIFKTIEDNYTTISKMWGDSYLNLYKPWLDLKESCLRK